MEKKYSVFISSTYEDLKEIRKEVGQTLVDDGYWVEGMELFPAADVPSWKIIEETIDKCDYYVLIVAHRYGSIEKESGISYTEKEYRYALAKEIQTLGFVIHEDTNWLPKHIEKGEGNIKLQNFIETITKKQIAYWKDVADLKDKIIKALKAAIDRDKKEEKDNRKGWIRANLLDDAKKENKELRTKIADLQNNVSQTDSLKQELEECKKKVYLIP